MEEMGRYYGAGYFMKRTERGYDNYFSGALRGEIERVFGMNLHDLGFFDFEKGLGEERSSLDIGCAAGYFVDFMKRRGWNSSGIDVSKECVDFAVSAGLDVRQGDYLATEYARPFDCVTLWASIEHLHHPHLFLEKIHDELAPGGMLYLSTCRAGGVNFMRLYGPDWRFYNLPEHLYYFSRTNIRRLLARRGFEVTAYRTYGSGFAKPGSLARRVPTAWPRSSTWET
jgi:SAM-dependent methyltransferase